jgi:hypothetical protein
MSSMSGEPDDGAELRFDGLCAFMKWLESQPATGRSTRDVVAQIEEERRAWETEDDVQPSVTRGEAR